MPEHNQPNCVGHWRFDRNSSRSDVCWRCELCNASLPATIQVLEAAVRENRMSFLLRELTWEGQQLLRS